MITRAKRHKEPTAYLGRGALFALSYFGHKMSGFQKREVEMRKTVLSTIGALVLLLTTLFTWNSQAGAYSGILAIGPIHSSVQKVDCDADDQICDKETHLVCIRGEDGKPECACEPCGGHGICPASVTICCPPGRCCTCGSGSFKCCPR
jgi:hypothetical protein